MYKRPSRERRIIAMPKQSVKLLPKNVTPPLKLTHMQTENYNFKTQYYSGVKISWPVHSNQNAINTVKKLNSTNKAT